MSLKQHIHGDSTIEDIAGYLDGLSHDARIEQMKTLGRSDQRTLYEKAGRSSPITMEHFVPADRDDGQEVIHHGRNTLPLPGPFKHFQKRFCRPPADGARAFGYNEGMTRPYLGPGFFVAVPTEGNPEWTERGDVVVDYFQVPDAPVTEGWPKVIPNSQGLQKLVYFETRDFMRKVSEHVSIGAAYKREKALGHFFLLVRED